METKILSVTSAKGNKETNRPRIRLSGNWLNDIGFKYNSLINIECSKNIILLKYFDTTSLSDFQLSKKILKEESKGLVHIKKEWRKKYTVPILSLCGFWLEKFEFNIGDIIAISYDVGIVSIRKIEL